MLNADVAKLTSEALFNIAAAFAERLSLQTSQVAATLYAGSAIVQLSIAGGTVDGRGKALELVAPHIASHDCVGP